MFELIAVLFQVALPNSGTSPVITSNFIAGVNSITGLYLQTNQAVGGLEGVVASLILFMVFLGASSFKVKLIDAAVVASALMMMLSVIMQLMGLTGNFLPVLWLGATILFGMISLLSGWTHPYD